jgi:hypothetical protein
MKHNHLPRQARDTEQKSRRTRGVSGNAGSNGPTPWMAKKQEMQATPEFKDCGPASRHVDLSYFNVF